MEKARLVLGLLLVGDEIETQKGCCGAQGCTERESQGCLESQPLGEPVPWSLGCPVQYVVCAKPEMKFRMAGEGSKKKWVQALLRGGNSSPLWGLCCEYLIKHYSRFFLLQKHACSLQKIKKYR